MLLVNRSVNTVPTLWDYLEFSMDKTQYKEIWKTRKQNVRLSIYVLFVWFDDF